MPSLGNLLRQPELKKMDMQGNHTAKCSGSDRDESGRVQIYGDPNRFLTDRVWASI